jgi:hypothetical protein
LLALLSALVWAADTGARTVAQALAARRIQHTLGLEQRPDVHVRGVFFVPQVLGGHYGRVDVGLRGLTRDGVRLTTVSARLGDVRVPLGEAVTGDADAVRADRATETVRVDWADLNAYLSSRQLPGRVSPGTDGRVAMTAAVVVHGRVLHVTAQGTVTATDGGIAVVPTGVVTSRPVGTDGLVLLQKSLTFVLPTSELPFGQRITAVRATGDGLEATATGTSVSLAQVR